MCSSHFLCACEVCDVSSLVCFYVLFAVLSGKRAVLGNGICQQYFNWPGDVVVL